MNNNNALSVREQNRLEALRRGKIVKRKKIFQQTIFSIFRFVILFGLCFIIIYPILQQVLMAFRAPQDINDPTVIWIPRTWSITNFKIGMAILNYWKALGVTIVVCLIVMLLQLFSTGLAGYAFSRLKFKYSNILFIFVVATIVIPPQAVSLSQYLFYRDLKLVGSYASVFLMNGLGMGIRSGIFIFVFKTFFQGLPKELEESAQIDGASVFRIFWNIMLPNARGAIITVALFSFVWQWNDSYFVSIFEVSTPEFPLLTMKLMNMNDNIATAIRDAQVYNIVGEEIRKNPLFIAVISNVCSFLCMIPLLIGYFFVQKQFVESIERSGIVG
ncbi:carbohydrate ABC transporter permease [Acholeplasma sp. OttesenSCG-928-E16]|nr:carbohydrate ABC transporter permease [Acholeplasma sp. OttesenSCG-928-E16]